MDSGNSCNLVTSSEVILVLNTAGCRTAIQLDSAIQNRTRIGLDFEKTSTGSDLDNQTALITAVKCLRRFFGY